MSDEKDSSNSLISVADFNLKVGRLSGSIRTLNHLFPIVSDLDISSDQLKSCQSFVEVIDNEFEQLALAKDFYMEDNSVVEIDDSTVKNLKNEINGLKEQFGIAVAIDTAR